MATSRAPGLYTNPADFIEGERSRGPTDSSGSFPVPISRSKPASSACPALALEGQNPSEKEWEMTRILPDGGGLPRMNRIEKSCQFMSSLEVSRPMSGRPSPSFVVDGLKIIKVL